MIDLYYWPTPNGKKVTIHLEEAGVDYRIVPLSISTGEQLAPEFLKMNPNARMPVMVDNDPIDGGEPLTIFESGAIMLYLAEKTGRFMPKDLRARYEVTQWLLWQMANQGPKLGEAGHFLHYAQMTGDVGDLSYAQRRFSDEAHRLYGVLNYRLHDRNYLAADEYTIADMICYPWTASWENHGLELSEFKHLKRWFDEVSERQAVQRGMAAGSDLQVNPSDFTAEEIEAIKKLIFNQRAIPVPE